MAEEKNRLVNIDIARCIGIILVVVGHYFPDGSPEWYGNLRAWIYSFHMPLFMFLSGYVYAYTRRENEAYHKFLCKKVKRLLIPYLVVSLIIIAIKLASSTLLGMELKNPVGAAAFLRILYYPEAAIHLWFIFALWWIFMIVPLFKTKGWRFALLAVSIVLHYLPRLVSSVHYPEIFCLDKAAEFLIYFMLAVSLFDLGLDLNKPGKAVSAVLLALFILNSAFHFAPFGEEFIGTAGIIAFASLLQYIPRKAITPLLAISRASYTVYLVHSIFIGFVVTGLKMICPALTDTGSPLFGVGALMTVTLTISLSMLLHRILSRCRINL